MRGGTTNDPTTLLAAAKAGDEDARSRLIQAIYDDLRKVASRLMRDERPDHTLQPTALVNEALLRLFTSDVLRIAPDRRYLFAAASRAMRQVLIDHARAHKAAKRGRKTRTVFDEAIDAVEAQGFDLVELNDELDKLASLEPRQYLVVTYRFFLGMTMPEVAEALDLSLRTAEKDWATARSWLFGRLGGTRR